MCLATPIFCPVALAIKPVFTILVTLGIMVVYILLIITFNENHLRRKKAMVSRRVAYLYYPLYKTVLRFTNVWSA